MRVPQLLLPHPLASDLASAPPPTSPSSRSPAHRPARFLTMSGRFRYGRDPDGRWIIVPPTVQTRASAARPSAQRGAHPSARLPRQSRAAHPPQTSRAGHAARPSASSPILARVDRQPVASSSALPPPRTQPTAAEADESDLTYSETDESEADRTYADESEADESEAVESVAAEAQAAAVQAGAQSRASHVTAETAAVRLLSMDRHWIDEGCLTCQSRGIDCKRPSANGRQIKCSLCSARSKPCSLGWILDMPRIMAMVQRLKGVDLTRITPAFLAAEREVYKNVPELGGPMDRCKDYSPLPPNAADRPDERHDHTHAPERRTSDRNAQTHPEPPSSEPLRATSARRKRTLDTMLDDDDMREQNGVVPQLLQQHQAELDFFGPTITIEQLLGVCARTQYRISEEMNR
ncbi:hypothetical protein PANT_19c00028 [Moesziomyces antarcticus T-34]|uniref:Zn(2)-C6 fungal-type domain-containing protein n=1 Tax=Pseudozyma antarctica (strain T-34) TaxID=1151754 RepID=M9MHB2_PSEA3|nr:hypothetical protein PANT_19c00028 [Moesziomyces antarcticus T-34]